MGFPAPPINFVAICHKFALPPKVVETAKHFAMCFESILHLHEPQILGTNVVVRELYATATSRRFHRTIYLGSVQLSGPMLSDQWKRQMWA
jgi:hypothetical protein